ncbi:Uncharacterised protein [uncultured archaeon]|nr:Uncharacterised protein [uncultured archaeon]
MARAVAFAALVLGNLALVLSSRSQSQTVVSTMGEKNDALLVVILVTLACLGLVLYVPFLQGLFSISAPTPQALATAAGCAFAAMIVFEVLKAAGNRRAQTMV